MAPSRTDRDDVYFHLMRRGLEARDAYAIAEYGERTLTFALALLGARCHNLWLTVKAALR